MTDQLGTGNINRLLWQLSIPAMLGMLSSAIFNVADRIFVGKIDPLALTAVGITMPIQILQMAFVLLIGAGSSTLVSIKLGEGEPREAQDYLYLAFKYTVLSMAFFAVVLVLFCDPILRLLSVSEQVMPMAKEYILILMVGGVIGIPGYSLNNSVRAIGKAGVSMRIIVITSILNIILDPLFIFVFDMGIAGAAIATVISQTVLSIYVVYFFYQGKELPIRLRFAKVPSERKLLAKIIKNGSPSFYVQFFATFINVFINWCLLTYGTDLDVASVTIMSTIFSFYHMVVFGIVQGNQPICGYNWGAKKYDRVLKSLELSLLYSFIISVILFLIIFIYPSLLVGMFSDDPVFIASTADVMRIFLSMIPLIGLQTISSQYFQSVGKPKLSGILSMLRYGILLVPIALIAAPRFGVMGIYAGNAISDFIACIIAIGFILAEINRLKKLHHDQSQEPLV